MQRLNLLYHSLVLIQSLDVFFLTHLCKCNQIFLKVQVIGVTEESSALQTVFVQTFKWIACQGNTPTLSVTPPNTNVCVSENHWSHEKRKKLTCFTEATSFSFGSAGAFTAGQVHQTQLTDIHLTFVLHFNNMQFLICSKKCRKSSLYTNPSLPQKKHKVEMKQLDAPPVGCGPRQRPVGPEPTWWRTHCVSDWIHGWVEC